MFTLQECVVISGTILVPKIMIHCFLGSTYPQHLLSDLNLARAVLGHCKNSPDDIIYLKRFIRNAEIKVNIVTNLIKYPAHPGRILALITAGYYSMKN